MFKKLRKIRLLDNPAAAIFNLTFLSLFLLCTVYVGLVPSQNKFGLFQLAIPILLGATAFTGLLFQVVNIRVTSKRIKAAYPYIATACLVVSFAILIVVAKALESYGYTWDSEQIFNQAVSYATTGNIEPGYVSYLQANPNNIPLLTALSLFFSAIHHAGVNNFLTSITAVNVVLMALTQVLILLVAKTLYSRRIALISILFSTVFISMSMYVQIPYTDTLALIFPILLLYLSLRVTRAKYTWSGVALSALIGAVAAIGYLIKPTIIIAAISIAIAALIWLFFAKKTTRSMKIYGLAAMCVTVCILTMAVTWMGYIKAVDGLHMYPFSILKTDETSLPPVHFMAMGLKTNKSSNTVNYGGYDDNQAKVVSNLPTKQEKINYSVATINQELSSYGYFGYLDFVAHKANWILSDATFYAYGEGSNDNVVFIHDDGISKFIRSFMYVDGSYYVIFTSILQVIWLAVLLLIGSHVFIVLVNKPSRDNIFALLPRLMIAGILLFLLLFEGRSRYIFLYLPIFIIAALHTLRWFQNTDNETRG